MSEFWSLLIALVVLGPVIIFLIWFAREWISEFGIGQILIAIYALIAEQVVLGIIVLVVIGVFWLLKLYSGIPIYILIPLTILTFIIISTTVRYINKKKEAKRIKEKLYRKIQEDERSIKKKL